MSKFLITGAAGFIGINTTKFLLEKNHNVIGIDNFVTCNKDTFNNFYDSQKNNINYNFDVLDLCNFKKSLRFFKKINPDYIIHLAAIPSVPRSVKNPIRSIRNNVISTSNVAEISRILNVKRLVYAGSSSYYGGKKRNSSEKETAPFCKSPYAASKTAGEHIINSYFYTYNLPTVILRFFNVFGPAQDPKSQYSAVIPAFISKILKNKRPIIYGSGLQSRDFTFVENVAYACYLACTTDKKVIIGDTYDVGCGISTSLNELLNMICQIMKVSIKPIYKKPRLGDVEYSMAHISRIEWFLGYTPIVSLREGLEKTIDYFKGIKLC